MKRRIWTALQHGPWDCITGKRIESPHSTGGAIHGRRGFSDSEHLHREIQLRKDEMQWQQRKFVLTVILMSIVVLVFAGLWTYRSTSSFYGDYQRLVFYTDRLDSELREYRKCQDILAPRLADLEASQFTLRRLADSSTETIQDLRRLINELRDQFLSDFEEAQRP